MAPNTSPALQKVRVHDFMMPIRVPTSLREWIRSEAAAQKISSSELVRKTLLELKDRAENGEGGGPVDHQG